MFSSMSPSLLTSACVACRSTVAVHGRQEVRKQAALQLAHPEAPLPFPAANLIPSAPRQLESVNKPRSMIVFGFLRDCRAKLLLLSWTGLTSGARTPLFSHESLVRSRRFFQNLFHGQEAKTSN
jgi:hypothetical protein